MANRNPNQKLAEARLWAARKLPYMRHQVMALMPVEKPGLGTMAVDEYGRLYFDSAFLAERDLKHLGFIVLHEAVHVWGRHATRCVRLIGEKPARQALDVWRKAVDASVNDVLEQSGLPCPAEGITPAKLGLPRNKTPEEYFDLLMAQQEQQEAEEAEQAARQPGGQQAADREPDGEDNQDGPEDQPEQGPAEGQGEQSDDAGQSSPQAAEGEEEELGDQGQGGSSVGDGGEPAESPTESPTEIGGSAADGQPRPWEDGPPTPEHPGMSEHDQNLIQAATAKEIESYQQQHGKGSVPAGLSRQAAELLHPQVDPARELLAKVKYAVGCTSGFGDFTYRKPNRRQPAGGALLPAHVKPIPRVTVIIDTSGSMEESDLAQALGVIGNALRSLPDPRGLRVLVGDTHVAEATNVFRPEQVELAGGGGTDMSALIVVAAEERPAPKAILVVTDGETGWPAEPVAPRVVACLTRMPKYCAPPPEWIDTVVLNPEEQR